MGASTAAAAQVLGPATARRSAAGQLQGQLGLMTQRAWSLGSDLAGVGTVVVTCRAVHAPPPAHIGVSQTTRPRLADALRPAPPSRSLQPVARWDETTKFVRWIEAQCRLDDRHGSAPRQSAWETIIKMASICCIFGTYRLEGLAL